MILDIVFLNLFELLNIVEEFCYICIGIGLFRDRGWVVVFSNYLQVYCICCKDFLVKFDKCIYYIIRFIYFKIGVIELSFIRYLKRNI